MAKRNFSKTTSHNSKRQAKTIHKHPATKENQLKAKPFHLPTSRWPQALIDSFPPGPRTAVGLIEDLVNNSKDKEEAIKNLRWLISTLESGPSTVFAVNVRLASYRPGVLEKLTELILKEEKGGASR